jgi:tryptophanyl-tRNA synthetase
MSFEKSRKLAAEEYLANYEALGLDVSECHVYFQSRHEPVIDLAFRLAKKVTFSTVRAIYGFTGETSVSSIYYPLIDVADILHPQLPQFGGPRPTVVPVGIDQDPHLRLARDLAAKFQSEYGFVLPASTYHRLLPGLLGEKMSSSRPETAIFLTDDDRTVAKKLKNAFTGGRPTAEEQRKLGGNPDVCRIFELYLYHLVHDDRELLEIRERCKSGQMICGECKQMAVDRMLTFLRDHRRKYEQAVPKAKRLAEKISHRI